MSSNYLVLTEATQIISDILGAVLPNLLVIVVSSFLGAYFILKGQEIQRKRNRLSAFYIECLDNAVELDYLCTNHNIEEPLEVHYASNIQSSALENLQNSTPELYARLYTYSDSFPKLVTDIELLKEFRKAGFWKQMVDAIEFPDRTIPDGGEPTEEIERDRFELDKAKENIENAIDDIQAYTKSNLVRKIYYRNCLYGSLVEVESENQSDNE